MSEKFSHRWWADGYRAEWLEWAEHEQQTGQDTGAMRSICESRAAFHDMMGARGHLSSGQILPRMMRAADDEVMR